MLDIVRKKFLMCVFIKEIIKWEINYTIFKPSEKKKEQRKCSSSKVKKTKEEDRRNNQKTWKIEEDKMAEIKSISQWMS